MVYVVPIFQDVHGLHTETNQKTKTKNRQNAQDVLISIKRNETWNKIHLYFWMFKTRERMKKMKIPSKELMPLKEWNEEEEKKYSP